MRIKLVVLLLCLVALALATSPVKSNDRDVAEQKKARKTKVEEKEMSLEEVEEDAGFVEKDSDEEVEEEEEVVDKKKKPSPKKGKKTKPEKETVSKKGKKEKQIPSIPEDSYIPNMTSFDFLGVSREHPLDKLREIIKDTPIEKLQEISEEEKDEETDDEDKSVYQACNAKTSPNNELCHCDQDEINCNSVVMDMDDPHLRTLNLAIQIKDFKPVYANFSENGIMRLKTGEVLPGYEKHVANFDLSYNEIRFMDSDVFKRFTNLTYLNLNHNNLQNVKKSVFNAARETLHRLDLGYNRIKTLDDNVFDGLVNLKSLSLDGNPIKNWRKEYFKGLENLEKLSLDNCGIEDLPADIFENLPKLTQISLRGNPMEEIPSVVANLKSLKEVDMSETSLTEIRDHAFAGDSDLDMIILQNMKFLTVVRDCGFCGLPKLKSLLINDNSKLIEIHPNAFGFVKSDPGHQAAAIDEFDMHHCNVSTISEHMLDYDKLDTFKVGENPWKCDCKIQFLMDGEFTFKADSVSPKCALPENLKDRQLESLRVVDACEDARFLGRSGRFSSVLGLALLVAFCVIGVVYLHSSGKLSRMLRKVRKEPEVTYTNLQNAGEDFPLETDFQPRPAEV